MRSGCRAQAARHGPPTIFRSLPHHSAISLSLPCVSLQPPSLLPHSLSCIYLHDTPSLIRQLHVSVCACQCVDASSDGLMKKHLIGIQKHVIGIHRHMLCVCWLFHMETRVYSML